MSYKFGKIIILGLGGSIVCPDEIDVQFLKEFKKLIEYWIKRGKKFVIVLGGGRLARKYQSAAEEIVSVSDTDKDWMGIYATHLNALLVWNILKKNAEPQVITYRFQIKKLRRPLAIASAAGWKPGASTDYLAVQLARDFGAKEMLIMGKPDYVYDKDNQKYKDAKPFTHLTWSEYKKLIPSKWKPGAHAPIDPIATKTAQKENIKVIVIGKSLANLNNLLKGKSFNGTLVSE